MSVEKEFKLKCSRAQYKILQSILDAQGEKAPRIKHQRNVYFDTPDFALKKQGVELRLRDIDGSFFEQTIKVDNKTSGNDGLFDRAEYNIELSQEKIDVSLFAMHPQFEDFKQIVSTIEKDKVTPLFITDYIRTAYQIKWQGSLIEAAYDTGTIATGKQSENIGELEIELIDGQPEHLAAFKNALCDLVEQELKPLSQSKGSRGYALYHQ